MNYTTAKAYIEGLKGRGISLGLDTLRRLLSLIGNPELNLNFIHITGTNGKGSVGAYLESVLNCAQKTVTRFLSPCTGEYLSTFLINGKSVDETLFTDAAEKIKTAIIHLEKEGVYPTSFEAETAVALEIFSKISPDYVILECGMGGENDATNVIPPPILSVITKISLDHTAYLGETVSEIAKDKSGIIKSTSQAVSFPNCKEASDVIEEVCKKKAVPLYIADTPQNIRYGINTEFDIDTTSYITKMLGTYQPHNAALAIKAAQVLNISENAIKAGILNAGWEYRFEKIDNFVLDGAHNPDGPNELAKSIKEYNLTDDTAFVTACFKDKDYHQMAKTMGALASHIYCVTAPTERGLDAKILCDEYIKQGCTATYEATLESAIKKASNHKMAVVFGTLSILPEAKRLIERIKNGTL